ncbi:hypothetical protein [Ruegeria arenilitoris]|uniref:hypothetical protein n=1 Tax=Ruegeria arenilitoris TaxID=1173585 RepID=UPI00147A3D2E|nr:hypothetical protein [Ruegeria arenilitoris]
MVQFENAKIMVLAVLLFLATTINCFDGEGVLSLDKSSTLTNRNHSHSAAITESVAPPILITAPG